MVIASSTRHGISDKSIPKSVGQKPSYNNKGGTWQKISTVNVLYMCLFLKPLGAATIACIQAAGDGEDKRGVNDKVVTSEIFCPYEFV